MQVAPTIWQCSILSAVLLTLLLAIAARADNEALACSTAASCKAQVNTSDSRIAEIDRYEIPAIDIRMRADGNEQAKIKTNGIKLKKDIAAYSMECTNVTVDTPAQQDALNRECRERQANLEERARIQVTDENVRMPALSQDVLNQTSKRKEIQGKRDRLYSESLQLKYRTISLVINTSKPKAAAACGSLPDAPAQACCHSVVYDGFDPARCGLDEIFVAFDKKGLFGESVIRPQAR